MPDVRATADLFPQVNCYQPPIVWDSANGFLVRDAAGNQWIDFTSTAVMTNTGHGHEALRSAVQQHATHGLFAQFSFASEIRLRLARSILELAPPGCEKVWFWTVGSEANECALRLARQRGQQQEAGKFQILTHQSDYHGWTLGAHQVSGDSAAKPWLLTPDSAIHHLPWPETQSGAEPDWDEYLRANVKATGVNPDDVCGIFIETVQGWSALPLPRGYVQAVRRWADRHDALLIFDEVQSGFGRTGRWFAHEHYDVQADLLCIAKGLTSSLLLAAVLGAADVLDLIPPGEITTTHAGHPVSCAAALANLDVLRSENLISEAERKGHVAFGAIERLQQRFPDHIERQTGIGLMRAIHVRNPETGKPDNRLAAAWTWAAVKHGVMLFYTNKSTIKVVPPLPIADDALVEGIDALGDALATVV